MSQLTMPVPSKNQLTMPLPSKIISVFDAWPILLRAYTFCSVPNLYWKLTIL